MSKTGVLKQHRGMRGAVRLGTALAVLLAGSAHATDVAGDAAGTDLAQLPIEQLLDMQVYSASKFAQKVSEAPSAVSVITAADIKAFGWRTLADILRSMSGLYVTSDRNYSYLGARGFLRPGDYNTRFLLLVDGYRTNDSVYDQAAIGSEFILDVDMIERVEFVPGAGSSIYGSNAFFGVINVISKRGRDLDGTQVTLEGGSFGTRKARASYGWHGEQGAELLLSASRFRSDGQDLYFPEFASTNGGIARGLDHDGGNSVMLKGSLGSFGLTLAHSERTKGIPTASFSQLFNDARARTTDRQSFADLSYHRAISDQTELSAHGYWGGYDYEGAYVYDPAPAGVQRDGTRGRWWGGEAKLVSTLFARHKLVAGAEFRRDYRRDQYNFAGEPQIGVLDDHRNGQRFGVYLQDEITLSENLLLNAGLRYDHDSDARGILNPRLALIWKAAPSTTLKTLFGKAFRAPNAYELFYQVEGAGGQKANPALKPERIRSVELVLEHQLGTDSRITGSLFRNSVSDLITQTIDPVDGLLMFQNLNKTLSRGVQMEFEHAWINGAKLRTSYGWQRTEDMASGTVLVNSPHRLGKFNLSAPLIDGGWRGGLEAQYVSRRRTLQGQTSAYWLVNATLLAARLAKGVEISASVYNLFDRRYADPGGEEHVQDAIPQDGRSFRLKLSYRF